MSASRVAGGGEGVLHLGDAEGAEVEDRGGEDGVGAGVDGGRKVLDRARSAAGDDRDGDLGADQPDQLEVEAIGGAVGVHRVEQDLAGAEVGGTTGPLDGVESGALPPAVGSDL